ncbi:hypothetical protein GCM10009820_10350 [Leifsonia soli]
MLVEPRNPALHRLDQNERHVGSCDREDEPGKAGSAADITHSPRSEEGSNDGAIQDVPRPQAGELERTDKSALFTLVREVLSESTREFNTVTEEGGRRLRFLLDVAHSFT